MGANRGLPTYKESRRVLQHHVPVGVQVPQDLRWVLIVNLVPNQGRGRRLNERGRFTPPDVKTLPIDERAVRRLDGHMRTLSGERSRALSYGATHWVSLQVRRGRQGPDQDQQPHNQIRNPKSGI